MTASVGRQEEKDTGYYCCSLHTYSFRIFSASRSSPTNARFRLHMIDSPALGHYWNLANDDMF